jgi:pyruvate formate lyase activating enzyme
MKGLIFSVKKYSVNDGPGIRVTFFLKGCPLNCIWCHNPEGISPSPETIIGVNRIGSREFSIVEDVGRLMSTGDILEVLEKERIFIEQSGGGVTFSGGEPMLQSDFLLEALKACKANGYHTAVDTSGYSSSVNFRMVVPYTDLFLYDIKHLDDPIHVKLTGVSNITVIENFSLLLGQAREVVLRLPVIPGLNDDPGHILSLKQFISERRRDTLKMINLLPYHKAGSSKYKRFSIPQRMDCIEPPSDDKMNDLKEIFKETGIKVKIGG